MFPVNITVFLQAFGGKFLGPNAFNNTSIRIHLLMEGQTYPFNYNAAGSGIDDGMISQQFSNASPYASPILTLQPTSPVNQYQTNYLTIDDTTVRGSVTVKVPNAPYITASIKAYIPRPTGLTLEVEQQIVLVPQQSNYTFIMPVAGLLLEPNPVSQPDGILSVLVKMMCGCQVTVGKSNSFWSPDDFNVSANVTFANNSKESYPMNFDNDSNNSAFYASIPVTSRVLFVCYTAQQYSTGNFGFFQMST